MKNSGPAEQVRHLPHQILEADSCNFLKFPSLVLPLSLELPHLKLYCSSASEETLLSKYFPKKDSFSPPWIPKIYIHTSKMRAF